MVVVVHIFRERNPREDKEALNRSSRSCHRLGPTTNSRKLGSWTSDGLYYKRTCIDSFNLIVRYEINRVLIYDHRNVRPR